MSVTKAEPLESTAYRRPAREQFGLRQVGLLLVAPWVLSTTLCLGLVALMSGQTALPQTSDLLLFSLLTGWIGPVLALAAWGLSRPRPGSERPIQDVTLTGTHVAVRAPRELEVDLAAAHAVVMSVEGGRASARLLHDDGDVVLHANVSVAERTRDPLESRPLDFDIRGVSAYQQRFGDALLAAVRAGAPHNRYEQARANLDPLKLTHADDSVVTVLRDTEDGAAVDYRASARPRPGEPGYERFVATEGRVVCKGVVIAGPHIVALCRDDVRRALPIGHTRATRVHGGLTLSVREETFVVSLHAGEAEALCRWLDVA